MTRAELVDDVGRVTIGAALAILVLAAVALLSGCRDLSPAVTAADLQREVGHASARALREHCTVEYERAQTPERVQDLNDAGCPSAARALATLRTSHALVVATLAAYDAGRCTSLVNQAPRECDLTGAVLDMSRAAQELATAVARVAR